MVEFAARRSDPFTNFKYRLTTDRDGNIGGFTEIDGLVEGNVVIDYREGNDTGSGRKLIGRAEYEPLVCKQGLGANTFFQDWRAEVAVAGLGGNLGPETANTSGVSDPRRQMSVEIFDIDGNNVAEWEVYECWPSKRAIESLTATGEILMQTLTITHEGLRQVL